MIKEHNNNVQVVKKGGASIKSAPNSKMIFVIFISLLLDLIAFTMILPVFPSLLEHYRLQGNDWLYALLSESLKQLQHLIGVPEKFNSVLFGGFLGSMYSFLQFVASPCIGALSDRFGRKPILILCMVSTNVFSIIYAGSSTHYLGYI